MRTYGRKAKSLISAAAARTADPSGAAPSSSIERAVLQLRGARALEVEGQASSTARASTPRASFRAGARARVRVSQRRLGVAPRATIAPTATAPRAWRAAGVSKRMDLASTSTVAEHVDVLLRLDAARGGGAARRRGSDCARRAGAAGRRKGRGPSGRGRAARRHSMCRIRGERIGDRGWSALQRAVEEEKRSSLRQLAAARDP